MVFVILLKVRKNFQMHQEILSEFLEDVALITDLDNKDDENSDKVSLMTIHLAKGLEFPYVFVVGLEEDLFLQL